jgi:trans-aconitate methyltransferase
MQAVARACWASCCMNAATGQIDGLDISPEMLAVARRKQVYRHLADADLNHAFSAPVPAYGAIVSAGTFVHGHVGATGFRQLFDLLKPGGVMACAISMTIWQDADVARIIAALPAHTLSNTVEAVIPGQANRTRSCWSCVGAADRLRQQRRPGGVQPARRFHFIMLVIRKSFGV